MPHVTVEQVLALRAAAIELEQELATLKASLPKIKADAVLEAIEEAAWYNNRTTASISDMEEYANKLEAGE